VNTARTLIFSTGPPPPSAAAALAALDLLCGEPRIVERLQRNARVLRDALAALRERDEAERAAFAAEVARATARFHVPQLLRLREALERLGAELGLHEQWA
jgi:7-keto-8-aminopelargonate synthetase-like enzyme